MFAVSECFCPEAVRRCGLLIVLLALPAGAIAVEESAGKSAGSNYDQAADQPADAVSIALYFDNDAFTGRNQDKDYTGGLALAFSGAAVASHPLSLDPALGWLDRRSGWAAAESSDVELSSLEIGIAAFTPSEIGLAAPIHDDRPYAGLVYLSNTRQSIDFAARSSIRSSLSVGVLGLSVLGQLQNEVHELIGANEAQGWENQIANGGEATFRYAVTWQNHLATERRAVQATTAAGFSLGYLTEALLGASIRTGKLRTPWWSFNVHNSNYGEKSNISVPISKMLDELFLVAGANVKLRAYNAFLQGQFRHSPVRYSSSDLEPLVYEAWLGVGGEFSSGLQLSYLVRRQTSELKSGQANRSFTYGELIASYKF